MSVVDQQSIFTSMKQDGPFAIKDELQYGHNFSAVARAWIDSYCNDPLSITKYRSVRSQIFALLQVQSFGDIRRLLGDSELVRQRSHNAYKLLANLYGIQGKGTEVASRIREYAASADEVITYLKQKVLADYHSNIEISNEIETTHNPVDLLLIVFNPDYHKKVRFEAKRKLVLMGLAGSIDQRERETDIEHKFSTFLNFLNQHIWSPHLKIGELHMAYLLSSHDPDKFSCQSVEVIEMQADTVVPEPVRGQKLTLVKRRQFRYRNQDIPVYVSVRKKDSAAKILKLLRKNEKNPAVAVDDELGLMAVLDSIADVKRFMQHLSSAAHKADSILVLEDISDNLTGGHSSRKNIGSDGSTPMLKFFARLGGLRVEFIIHSNQTYLNYRYQSGIAHDEYEVRRLFDTGVAEFLFPRDIYLLDLPSIRNAQLHKFRQLIEAN